LTVTSVSVSSVSYIFAVPEIDVVSVDVIGGGATRVGVLDDDVIRVGVISVDVISVGVISVDDGVCVVAIGVRDGVVAIGDGVLGDSVLGDSVISVVVISVGDISVSVKLGVGCSVSV
jgi:hypothetical protein